MYPHATVISIREKLIHICGGGKCRIYTVQKTGWGDDRISVENYLQGNKINEGNYSFAEYKEQVKE